MLPILCPDELKQAINNYFGREGLVTIVTPYFTDKVADVSNNADTFLCGTVTYWDSITEHHRQADNVLFNKLYFVNSVLEFQQFIGYKVQLVTQMQDIELILAQDLP